MTSADAPIRKGSGRQPIRGARREGRYRAPEDGRAIAPEPATRSPRPAAATEDGHPDVSVAQEPSIVPLPDGGLFCVMRTATGNPYYTVSRDEGNSWAAPEPLRQTDDRLPFRHPCSPCPIYLGREGEYIFLFHNHDGHFGGWGPKDTSRHRRPVYLCRGRFRPHARQPIWFSEPLFFMDHGGVSILRGDLAMYASVTTSADGLVLWYPDRKFFLLGKRVSGTLLDGMAVPE